MARINYQNHFTERRLNGVKLPKIIKERNKSRQTDWCRYGASTIPELPEGDDPR